MPGACKQLAVQPNMPHNHLVRLCLVQRCGPPLAGPGTKQLLPSTFAN